MKGESPETACATAPGKVILLGEHAVVYGRTALAAAIDRHVTVHVSKVHGAARPSPFAEDPRLAHAFARATDVVGVDGNDLVASICSDVPLAMGLGSSAALSVALLRALTRFAQRSVDDAVVCAGAFEIEKIFHGFPSGIDNTVATYGGLIAFTRGAAPRALPAARPLPLVTALGRAPRHTQHTVTALRRKWEAKPEAYEPHFDEISALVNAAERAVATGDLTTLGATMSANHAVLQRLAISTDELDQMVALARSHGALGAKLTGGGGGGAVICLCDGSQTDLVNAFSCAGWQAFATDIAATRRGAHAADSSGHLDQYVDR